MTEGRNSLEEQMAKSNGAKQLVMEQRTMSPDDLKKMRGQINTMGLQKH